MTPEQINLLITLVLTFNTIILAPLFKNVMAINQQIAYIKGHLKIGK